MKCPECNKEYKDDFKFYPYCGSKVIIKYCIQCDFKSHEVNFCPECGVKLLTEAELYEKEETLRNYVKAIEYCNKLIKINPENEENYYNKVFCLKELERWKEAIECYDKAIELEPNNKEYKNRLKELQKTRYPKSTSPDLLSRTIKI